ncbi:MAG: HEAT repeat domain-containing protein [Streptomyces sp.]|nr:HEAT repeat domain-containing protein [Streptomyces sp.]
MRDPSQSNRLAAPAAVVLGQSAPTEEEALRDWIHNQVALLVEPRPEVVVEAALALMEVGYTRGLVPVADLIPRLTSTLSRGPCEATAAAWALGWVKRSSDDSHWRPSPDELAALADAVASTRLPPQAVLFVLWCFDNALVPPRDDMASAVMDAYVSADRDARRQIGDKYLTLFPETVEPVVRAAQHHREDVRHEASLLLARLDDSLAVDSLLRVLTGDNGAPHTDVVQALARLGDPRAVEPLLGLLSVPDSTVNHAVASALGDLRDSRAVQPLLEALPHTSGTARTTVVQALGSLGDPRAVEPLLGLLSVPDPATKHAVASALGDLRDSRAVQPLLEALPHTSEMVRSAVVQALGDLRDPRALEPLLDLLAPARGGVDSVVALALGRLGDSRAVQPLLDVLTERGGRPGTTAVVEALGRLGDRRAVEPLLSTLRDAVGTSAADDELLATIVEALVGIGDPRALQPLSQLREIQTPRLRFRVPAARAALGDTVALDTLHEAMERDIAAARRNALWSLAVLESEEVDRVLLSKDHDGVAPGIDPQERIEESVLPVYATAARLPLQQVRSRYEELAKRYPLRLSWRPSAD